MWLRIGPLKVAMVTQLMRTGLEPSEFPRTETGRVTGREDDTMCFSLEPLGNAAFPLFL